MKTLINKLKRKSLTWWGLWVAVIGLLIALAAWLLPEPLKNIFSPTPSLAQTLGITQPIPTYAPGTIRILVATFDGPDEDARKVSADIKTTLEKNLASEFNSNIEIIGTNRVITEMEGSDIATQIGELYKASIVIWGWYGVSEELIPLGIHFEIIPSSGPLEASVCPASVSRKSAEDKETFENLTFQSKLSNEYSYATLFTLGLARFEAGDWNNAIAKFDDAIKYIPDGELSAETSESKLLIDKDLLYYYRGIALRSTDRFSDALSNYKEIETNWSGIPAYHIELGLTNYGLSDEVEAAKQFSLAYENSENSGMKATALLFRGIVNYQLGNYEDVNQDLNLAITTDENYVIFPIRARGIPHELKFNVKELESGNLDNAVTYYLRGVNTENPDDAIRDFSKAIEIAPNFLAAHYERGYLNLEKGDSNLYQAAVDDFSLAMKSEVYITPCAYNHIGRAYYRVGNKDLSKKSFLAAISLSNETLKSDPSNVYAYFQRGNANQLLGNNFIALFDIIRLKFTDNIEASDLHVDEALILVIKAFGLQILPTIPFILVGIRATKILLLNKKTKKITPHAHRP